MKLYHIVAVSSNGVIGNDNQIPWKIKGDLGRFKTLTLGHPVIMGRNTFESLGSYGPLPGRLNIVLSSRPSLTLPDGTVILREEMSPGRVKSYRDDILLFGSLADALAYCSFKPEVYVIGGSQVYKETFEFVHEIRMTHVHQIVEGDVFYPALDPEDWIPSYSSPHPSGTHTYTDYVRRVT